MHDDSSETPVADDLPAQARGIARNEYAAWLTNHSRSAWARHLGASLAGLWTGLSQKVTWVATHEAPALANRRWLVECVTAWAPLEVVFPGRLYARDSGVTGELSAHVAEIIEREYGHVVAGARGVARASELLHADAQRLELSIATSTALHALLETESAGDWRTRYVEVSLALAEYMHRQALGLSQVLSDTRVMSYTTEAGRVRRSCVGEAPVVRIEPLQRGA